MTTTASSTRAKTSAAPAPSDSEPDLGPAITGMLKADAPADLIGACEWAIQHSHWTNDPARPDRPWPDERVNYEIDRYSVVLRRAISEPSRSIDELKAKARLLLTDLHDQDGEEGTYDDDKLARVVLREVIALEGDCSVDILSDAEPVAPVTAAAVRQEGGSDTAIPTDLADACAWAAVVARAIEEPAAELATLAAMARLYQQDALLEAPDDETSGDLFDRLALKIMRQLITLSVRERAVALVEAIEAEWAPFASIDHAILHKPERESEWEAASARRNALIDAADALPCTCREARHAKGLALAWIEASDFRVENWRRETSRTNQRLALDIDASLRAA